MKVDNDFVKQYGPLIRDRIRAQRVVPEEDVSDMESLVYIRLTSHPSYDSHRGPFTTWLGWVVKSVVSNEVKKKVRSTDALDHAVDLQAAANVIGAEDAGTAKDELTRIFKAAELTRRDEGIIRDIHLEGYTYEEAAERAGMTLEAVKKVVYRAMSALRSAAG